MIAAEGAAYHNGFTVRHPGVKYSQVACANASYKINGRPATFTPIERGRDAAIQNFAYNLWETLPLVNRACISARNPAVVQMSFEAEVPMRESIDVSLSEVFDPFSFVSAGAWHNGHFLMAPGRGDEIHLKNQKRHPRQQSSQSQYYRTT